MRHTNPNANLVVFWVKLRQRGYTQSISGLYRVLRRIGRKPMKLPNPKKENKPYEQMQYPGQKRQIDVNFVPKSCLAGEAAEEGGYFQYTFIDAYSRFTFSGHIMNVVMYNISLTNLHVYAGRCATGVIISRTGWCFGRWGFWAVYFIFWFFHSPAQPNTTLAMA